MPIVIFKVSVPADVSVTVLAALLVSSKWRLTVSSVPVAEAWAIDKAPPPVESKVGALPLKWPR